MVSKSIGVYVYVYVYVVCTKKTIIVEEPKRTNLPPNFHSSWPFSFLSLILLFQCCVCNPIQSKQTSTQNNTTITSKERWMHSRLQTVQPAWSNAKRGRETKEEWLFVHKPFFFCLPWVDGCLVEGNFFVCFLSGEGREEREKVSPNPFGFCCAGRSVNYI